MNSFELLHNVPIKSTPVRLLLNCKKIQIWLNVRNPQAVTWISNRNMILISAQSHLEFTFSNKIQALDESLCHRE